MRRNTNNRLRTMTQRCFMTNCCKENTAKTQDDSTEKVVFFECLNENLARKNVVTLLVSLALPTIRARAVLVEVGRYVEYCQIQRSVQPKIRIGPISPVILHYLEMRN